MKLIDWDEFRKYYMSGIGHSKCDIIGGRSRSKFANTIRFFCSLKDWEQNKNLLDEIPNQYRKNVLGLLSVGFSLKEAYDLLKETYNF